MNNKFTPKILIGAIVAFLIVVGGFILFKPQGFKSTSESSPVPESSTLAASAENTSNLGEYYDGTAGAHPSASATPIPTPAPISEYIYPGSKTTASASAKLELQTTASPTEVTDWYKNKIKSVQFNAQSFSASNTSGAIFNKLSAAKPGEKIEVTIKKDQSASETLITVDRL